MTKSTKNTAAPHARARARIASRALDVTPTKARRRKAADVVDVVPASNEPVMAELTPTPVPSPVDVTTPPVLTVIAAPASSRATKSDLVLKQLATKGGISIVSIMEATGWQAHSVRGFLSAVVRKKHGLNLLSDVGKDGVRRYRIETPASAGS